MSKKEKNEEKKNKKNTEKIENNQQDENLNKNFFKKLWYSIDKIEKYPELSAEGFNSALKYAFILILIIGIIASATTVYKTTQNTAKITNAIEQKAPEFTYKDGTLSVEQVQTIQDDDFGKIIIDTKTDEEATINEYIDEIKNEENGAVILKNKIILRENSGTPLSETYSSLTKELRIDEFNKQDLINYLRSDKMNSMYAGLFITLLIYAILIYIINMFFYVLLIAIIGYLTALALKLKLKFVAVFNMAIYSVTLSTILNMVYIIVNTLFGYDVPYFGVMYVLIASIYMIASIFILKTEFNKKQGEVQRIVEIEDEAKNEAEEKEVEKKEEDKDKNKEANKKEKEEKEKTKETKNENKETEDKDNDGEQPAGA